VAPLTCALCRYARVRTCASCRYARVIKALQHVPCLLCAMQEKYDHESLPSFQDAEAKGVHIKVRPSMNQSTLLCAWVMKRVDG
jgi:hypothetical protein